MKGRGTGWLILIVAALVALMFFLVAHFAHAHDHERPGLTGWYQSLGSGKGPCCDGTDAKHLADVDWDTKRDGDHVRYRVRIEDQWWDVPDDAVLAGPNLDGRTLVWPIYYHNMDKLDRIEIRCFMPGSMT